MKNKSFVIYLILIGFLFVFILGWYVYAFLSQPEPEAVPTTFFPVQTATHQPTPTPAVARFNGQRAYADVETQVAFGPRIPGSEGHAKIQVWMREELESAGWVVEVQESESMGQSIQNIVAKRRNEHPQIILGAHYDTRIFADRDPDSANRIQPVPGANDGASGVAILLEMARVLPVASVPTWLVFFDAEDNGQIEGWDWILGSREFVKNNPVQPKAVVIVDMVGDADLNIFKERNSNPELTNEIWDVAKGLGFENIFIPEYKFSMLDDHTPFLEAGIPAVDIIDFDYPYWHTLQDAVDKVSPESLQAVGETIQTWIIMRSAQP